MTATEDIFTSFRNIINQMVIYVDSKDGADLSRLLTLARSFASAPLSVESSDFAKKVRAARVFIGSQIPENFERGEVIAFLKATSKFAKQAMSAKKYKLSIEQFIQKKIGQKDWKETTILMIILYKMADNDAQKDHWLIKIATTTSLRLQHLISPQTSYVRAKKAISIGVHPEKVYLVTYQNGQRNWLVSKEMKGLHEPHYRLLRWKKNERYVIETNGEQDLQFAKIHMLDFGTQTLK